jgi:two-component system CheB/CheR fusion protein
MPLGKPPLKKASPSKKIREKLPVPNTEETAVSPLEAPAEILHKFHIVGIGASAGGLAAIEAFLSAMPAHT